MATTPRGRKTQSADYQPKIGRPSEAQLAAINDVIKEKAAELFLSKGYDATSMEAVASLAGVSKGTLYRRYSGKSKLLRAVVEDRVEGWSSPIYQKTWSGDETLEERLKYYAKNIMDWTAMNEARAFDRLLRGSWEAPREVLKIFYEARYRKAVDLLSREIGDATAQEGRPARNPGRVAEVFATSLAGWYRIESAVRQVSKREAIAYAYDAVDLLLAGRSGW